MLRFSNMKSQTKTALISLFEPKSTILNLALLNFVYFWIQARDMGGKTCLVCPWYYPWTYTNEPTFLLLAVVFIRFGKFWTYASALALSSYVIANYIYVVSSINMTWFEILQYFQNNAAEVLVLWDTQHLFAAIIFGFALFYLVRGNQRKSAFK
ncbi:MAG: hypothetical protein M3209_04855 [Acidobacteriota bacterium]|nr:hypothetical protein [Acidobacteriota bacterium]